MKILLIIQLKIVYIFIVDTNTNKNKEEIMYKLKLFLLITFFNFFYYNNIVSAASAAAAAATFTPTQDYGNYFDAITTRIRKDLNASAIGLKYILSQEIIIDELENYKSKFSNLNIDLKKHDETCKTLLLNIHGNFFEFNQLKELLQDIHFLQTQLEELNAILETENPAAINRVFNNFSKTFDEKKALFFRAIKIANTSLSNKTIYKKMIKENPRNIDIIADSINGKPEEVTLEYDLDKFGVKHDTLRKLFKGEIITRMPYVYHDTYKEDDNPEYEQLILSIKNGIPKQKDESLIFNEVKIDPTKPISDANPAESLNPASYEEMVESLRRLQRNIQINSSLKKLLAEAAEYGLPDTSENFPALPEELAALKDAYLFLE